MPIQLINLFWLVQTTQSPGMNIKQAANHKHLIIASQINSTCVTKKIIKVQISPMHMFHSEFFQCWLSPNTNQIYYIRNLPD